MRIITLFISIILIACNGNNQKKLPIEIETNTLKENQHFNDLETIDSVKFLSFYVDPRDGNKYEIIKIDSMFWFNQNLKYRISSDSLKKLNFNGEYYNLEESRNACPDGWRLTLLSDWEKLCSELSSNKELSKYVNLNYIEPQEVINSSPSWRGTTTVNDKFWTVEGNVFSIKEITKDGLNFSTHGKKFGKRYFSIEKRFHCRCVNENKERLVYDWKSKLLHSFSHNHIKIDTLQVINGIKENYYSIKSKWNELLIFVDGVGVGEKNVPVILGGYKNKDFLQNTLGLASVDINAYKNAKFKIFSERHFEGDFYGNNNHFIAILKDESSYSNYEFYVKNTKLYFVFKFNPIDKTEQRFYFNQNEELIRWINDGKFVNDTNSIFLDEGNKLKKLLGRYNVSVRRN